MRRVVRGLLSSAAWMPLLVAVAAAQPAGGGTPAGDPIRCWWRSSAGAVAIGEPFDVVLTCEVRDDATLRAIVDESRLGAEAVRLAPFEVLAGAHPADLRGDGRRFFQYRYTLRIIDPATIGGDARLPAVPIQYRIESREGTGGPVEGRQRVYVLPSQPVRVLSLVPTEADDIRDSSDEDFSRIEALRFRARAFRLSALALAVLSVAVLVPVLARLARRAPDVLQSARGGRVMDSVILGQLIACLTDVQRESRGGWTPDLAQRAAAALRVAAACALRRPLSQRPHERGGLPPAGRVMVPAGITRRSWVSVSSPVTPAEIAREVVALPPRASPAQHQLLEGFQRSLGAMTGALYRPSFDVEGSMLDEALAVGLEATRRLRRTRAWPRRLLQTGTAPARVEARA